MSLELVNGFVCRNCTDVDLAKRGVDPSHPKADPKSPKYDPASKEAREAKDLKDASATDAFGPAIRVGGPVGAEKSRADTRSDDPARDRPRPAPPPGQGRVADLYA